MMLRFNFKNLLLFMLLINHAIAGSKVCENTVKFKYGRDIRSVSFKVENDTNSLGNFAAADALLSDVEGKTVKGQLILSIKAPQVGRKETAVEFNNQVNYNAIAIDRVSNTLPKKLHFFITGKLKIDDVEISNNVLLGQGKSGLFSNNWWFGGSSGTRHSSGYAMTLQEKDQKYCVYTYDSNVFKIAKGDCNRYEKQIVKYSSKVKKYNTP